MAWDFSTDPEFAAQLEWMRTFVDEEIEPLSLFYDDMTDDAWTRATAPLKQQVKDRDLWACHLDPELGGQGYGQVKLALMHEILGRCRVAPNIFGNQAPDSGNSELIAIGGTPEQKEQWLEPLLRGEITSSFSLTEPHFSGSDPTMIATRAERDGDEYVINGHKWFASNASKADFILMMAVTNPENPPHKAASFFIIPKGTPGLDIARDVFNMGHPYPGHFRSGGHAEIFLRDCRVPGRQPRRRGGRRLRARAAAPQRRSHPPRDAVGRPVRSGVRHDVRARRSAAAPRASCSSRSR